MHSPIPEQGIWLRQVVTGFFAYHAVPTNFRALLVFRAHIKDLWLQSLRRRSQKDQTTWERIGKLTDDFLPQPRILHPWPQSALCRQSPEVGAVCGKAARTALCGGRPVMGVPTAFTKCVHTLARKRGPEPHARLSAALDARFCGHDEEERQPVQIFRLTLRRALGVLAAMTFLLVAGEAWAQKSGGILKVHHQDSPASMSIIEEATYSTVVPIMGVFNNLGHV